MLPSFLSQQVKRGDYLFASRLEDEGAELSVVCAGWEGCEANYEIRRDGFSYFAMEYVAAGDWELEMGGKVWRLGAGAVFSYGPGVRYRLRALGESGHSKYFVDFVGKGAEGRLGESGLGVGAMALVLRHRWLRELFDQLVEAKEFDEAGRNRIADLTLALILERLPLHLAEGGAKTQAWVTFERCRGYMAEHYLEIGSLAEAARACGVASAYLSRLFRKHSNETPKAFLDRLKMSHAAQKLRRGNLQVKEAAAECGYADVFHFSRVFKKTFGVPPSVFARSGRDGSGS